ncbi:MAG: response regulator transcription factor [Methylococcaceae bacterium]
MQEFSKRYQDKADNKVYSLVESSKVRRKIQHDSSKIKIALLDNRAFALASFSDYLNRADDQFFVSRFSGTTTFLEKYSKQSNDFDLVLLNVGAKSVKCRDIDFALINLRQQASDLPIIIVADFEDVDSILAALKIGVCGYITTSLAPSVVLAAINLVHAGGVYIPSAKLCDAFSEHINCEEGLKQRNPLNPICLSQLTPRQLEVLERLRTGEPNKVIAYDLGMQECTVKAHVRDIMKKLKATNRTHLAFLASRLLPKAEPVG